MANGSKIESNRRWLAAFTVAVSAVVSYMAFWHISPLVTFVIGCLAAFVLICAAIYYFVSA